ncbi:PD-(D/E)XK nuclease family protein [Legionella quinlivanii]|uniref:PD-(D/E)XK nuclease family protein n=1 Tax=Legionella quinlivanii TaxID=45073 RepID=UPI0022443D18|nr:PD-(D/E)XK nuclease family protein [Legionella quinlivanii]MCW8450051.1 PD-(D/E)XK nuclease family protein [Legionella quinlivanii]
MIAKDKLFALMADGAVVITPTKRLSIELLEQFFQFHSSSTLKKPLCMPYQDFLRMQYNRMCFDNSQKAHPLLLNKTQYDYLWLDILKQQTEITLHTGLIDAVKDAWAKCQRWQLDINTTTFSQTAQTQSFAKWSLLFQQALDKIPAIVDEQLADYLALALESVQHTASIWVCFEEYTPQQKSLQIKLERLGCNVLHTTLNPATSITCLYQAKNASDEYEEMIAWTKTQLSEARRIGVVVPSLETEGTKLQRLLQNRLPNVPYSISLGKPLSEYPLVGHAMQWLKLDCQTLSNHQARLLLYSPFLHQSSKEFLKRAQFIQNSVSLQEERIDWHFFLQELHHQTPGLYKTLSSIEIYPQSASPSQWLQHFQNRLNHMGFPGDQALDSETYQCLQKLLNLFSELKQLQLFSSNLSQEQALDALHSIASNTIFQPKAEKSGLHIMGVLEASGARFDALWVTGMTDECLPKKIKPSAFIPLEYQRIYTSSEYALNLAEKQFDSFLRNAPLVVFSYASIDEDKPQLPSPLLKDTVQRTGQGVNNTRPLVKLEKLEETYQIPQSKPLIKGSTALLAKQSKCPFQAFAAHRLHAQQSQAAFDGLNLLERGQLTHKALEYFWLQVIDQERLLALSEEELNALISDCILSAIEPYRHQRVYSFSPLIQQVEIKRLHRLLSLCLEWEKERPEFKVEALEKSFLLTLQGIEFNLRVDRIDQLADGSKWVIDYKTSIPSSLPWNEERPREPQLLMYALLDQAIDTLIFSALKEGQHVCKGLSEKDYELKNIQSLPEERSWAEARAGWQESLEQLAKEFAEGFCPPKPVNRSVCQQCNYASLCRINHN